MNVEEISIEKIIPYARNPRKNDAAIAKVAASIKEFGFQQPIVVDGEMVVVVGHTRLEAARSLEMDTVPVHIATGLSEQQIKAYRLADNRVAQDSNWDYDLLPLELEEIGDAFTGFTDEELKSILGEVEGVDFPDLNDGDKGEFEQITFTLHESQAELIKEAIDRCLDQYDVDDSLNNNKNANAISKIVGEWLANEQ